MIGAARALLLAFPLLACSSTKSASSDTIAACTSDADCRPNTHCLAGYCDAEDCDRLACPDGWSCVPYTDTSVFGSGGGKLCELPCTGGGTVGGSGSAALRGSCPKGFACTDGYCAHGAAADGAPSVKVDPEMSTVTVGDSVTLHAVVESANGAVRNYDWGLGDGTFASTADVTHTYDGTKSAYAGSVVVTDSAGVTARATFTVTMCRGAGGPCGSGGAPDCCAGLVCTDMICK